jgi:hypothetical protein
VHLLKLRNVKILHEEHVPLSAAHVCKRRERSKGRWERKMRYTKKKIKEIED